MRSALLAILLLASPLGAAESFDVVVVGGTPGGIAAAIAAARQGRTAAIVEYHGHVGAMSASGLGKSDVETRDAIGGLFREFVGQVKNHYIAKYGADSNDVKLCKDGYYYEPHVAEKVFNDMLAKEKVKIFLRHRLDRVTKEGNRVAEITATNRDTKAETQFQGKVFIDATYEGDLFAMAGAKYRLGRESRSEFNELHAGVVYQNYEHRTFLAGTTGEGDKRIPAYTYRLCLTTDPANSVILKEPPAGYDRKHYLGYLDDVKAGRMGAPKVMKEGLGYFAPTFGTAVRALSIAEIPNKKTDVNMNPRPLGFPFCEINYAYPEANWDERERISERIRNLTLGLVYFLQNDAEIPQPHRDLARKYNLAKDEFADNGHFPWQLYVREARRLEGLYTLNENDLIVGPELGRTKVHADSIAAGEFPIDSFPVRLREPGHDVALEGYILMLDQFTRPYQIPYRVMIPKEVDGLIVPVAASTTHVAFSTVRLEPTWMALGQAAGVAAHLCIENKVQPRSVDVPDLQRQLVNDGQVITYFKDLKQDDGSFAAFQYMGARGFFPDYFAKPNDVLDKATWDRWAKQWGKPLPGLPRRAIRTRADFCGWLFAAGR